MSLIVITNMMVALFTTEVVFLHLNHLDLSTSFFLAAPAFWILMISISSECGLQLLKSKLVRIKLE